MTCVLKRTSGEIEKRTIESDSFFKKFTCLSILALGMVFTAEAASFTVKYSNKDVEQTVEYGECLPIKKDGGILATVTFPLDAECTAFDDDNCQVASTTVPTVKLPRGTGPSQYTSGSGICRAVA
ncbi:uncharacterized protein BX664DRAFT_314796 [Halteromyces radiatus]|uniref:uncharacterized protein n=1 Tax=Halteromyces radiatus TaxID=101107 RepID=UPI00221E83A4|nr:uncharacterized protein BX664DRAFT_314796 [Halteromyces radiatus]KAI8089606.1 hypothetical protein BX664DRAFT_314796 [Halteromyces radiatus]